MRSDLVGWRPFFWHDVDRLSVVERVLYRLSVSAAFLCVAFVLLCAVGVVVALVWAGAA